MTSKILVVEDEHAIRLALKGLLKRTGYAVEIAEDGEMAIERLRNEAFDLVITDLALGHGASGMDVLRVAKEERPETGVVMITAHGSEKIAVEAMKSGADDYVPKPFDNDELRVIVARSLDRHRLQRENRLLREQIQRDFGFDQLIGAGKAMHRVFETIQKVAETDLSVMIQGESGTGKELVAQALHTTSSRRSRPFVAVNCAAINRELVESELFGHEKGAFTGADRQRIGRFEAAEGGTIFLDEIGDMALETQAKVLRVLEERKLERVGSTQTIEVDVRVVSATHRDLDEAVRKNAFREDLYYRLKVVEIDLPPLRERIEDLAALSDRFLGQVAKRLEREKKSIGESALARLSRHTWPGNVRELRNVLERAAVLAPNPVIDAEDLQLDGEVLAPGPASAPTAAESDLPFSEAKRQTVESFERQYLSEALREHGGNVSKTASSIGMVRQSLQQKIRELGLKVEEFRRQKGGKPD
jgi:DNA-binding NtrC family response regulator